jgi:hypothetical protein
MRGTVQKPVRVLVLDRQWCCDTLGVSTQWMEKGAGKFKRAASQGKSELPASRTDGGSYANRRDERHFHSVIGTWPATTAALVRATNHRCSDCSRRQCMGGGLLEGYFWVLGSFWGPACFVRALVTGKRGSLPQLPHHRMRGSLPAQPSRASAPVSGRCHGLFDLCSDRICRTLSWLVSGRQGVSVYYR